MTALVSGVDKKNRGVTTVKSPYTVEVTVVGTDNILFHRYDPEAVETKANSKKGSIEKKTDNVESYVARNEKNEIVMPRENFKACICKAAKSHQDPRSPRKSAMELFKMGIKVVEDASFKKNTWDFLDKRGVSVNMSRVTRVRPGILKGWKLTFRINVILPEYIDEDFLSTMVTQAGFQGLGDFRPDFGQFRVESFKKL